MKTLGILSGTSGSDTYAAGSYRLIGYDTNSFFTTDSGEDVLLKKIRAVEWCGEDFVISDVEDADGRVIDNEFNWLADGVTITTDHGMMVFGCDVAAFTTSAACKCWYV